MSRAGSGPTPGSPDGEVVLSVEDLSVTYRMDDGPDVRAVRDVSFEIRSGRTFGLVGESGCGKTTAARSLIGLLDENGEVTGGRVYKDGRDLTALSEREIRDVRWSEIATIPQNVMNSLNPVDTVGSQVVDVIQLHTGRSQSAARAHAEDLFERVGLDPGRMEDYPHEFSGGMLQRAVIAMAMSCDPDLIIADEPTTALDVVVQDEILTELAELQAEFDVAVLIISHDIGVMAEVCDDVGVMYAGEMMELGTAEDVFLDPSNPYTLGLQNSFPNIEDPDRELVSIPGTAPDLAAEREGCPFVDRCPFAERECREVRPDMYLAPGATEHRSRCHFVDEVDRLRAEADDPETWGGGVEDHGEAGPSPDAEPKVKVDALRKYFDNRRGIVDLLFGREATPVKAVDGVSFEVREGEMFGIVGESGCGKSTLGRTLLDLESPTDGVAQFADRSGEDADPPEPAFADESLEAGESLPGGTVWYGDERTDHDDRAFRRAAQIIFQDPFESLNPRLTVRQTLMEPISLLSDGQSYSERVQTVRETLEAVGLSPAEEYMDRFPEKLSGGERQRVSIARALVVDPTFLLADEPVSMLDVSIRASILNILRRLRREEGLTLSIISHDLSLIRNTCDRTAVMYLGEFVEVGDTDLIAEDPKHPYAQILVDSVPVPDPTREREPADISGEPPSARDPPSGCRFHTRCPKVIPPEEFDFEQERFRELMDLRLDVAEESIRVGRIRERLDDPDDPATVATAIKEGRFSGPFRDPEAEAVVDEALELVAREEFGEATERLAAAFTTPCETDSPDAIPLDDGRQVRCHLYDDRYQS